MRQQKNKLLRNERCPKCAKLGKDLAGDNLAVYSNGKWCFSCGYMESVDGVTLFRDRIKDEELLSHIPSSVFFPEDVTLDYPQIALDWIHQYELTRQDLLRNSVVWSNSYKRLIFPIFTSTGSLLCYQGRYFGEEKKPKWFGVGELKQSYHILGRGNTLYLTEDIISAIKVSKFALAMPLFGVSIGVERFKRLYDILGPQFKVIIWLDPDKRQKALQEARIGKQMGLDVSVQYSSCDPKELPYKEMEKII